MSKTAKYFVRKVHYQNVWQLLNARGELLGVFMSLAKAIAAREELEARN